MKTIALLLTLLLLGTSSSYAQYNPNGEWSRSEFGLGFHIGPVLAQSDTEGFFWGAFVEMRKNWNNPIGWHLSYGRGVGDGYEWGDTGVYKVTQDISFGPMLHIVQRKLKVVVAPGVRVFQINEGVSGDTPVSENHPIVTGIVHLAPFDFFPKIIIGQTFQIQPDDNIPNWGPYVGMGFTW